MFLQIFRQIVLRLKSVLDRVFGLVAERPWLVLGVYAIAVVIMTVFTAANFKVNTDLTEMVSPELPFRKLKKEFENAFPNQKNTLVVVVDGAAPEAMRVFQREVYAELKARPELFSSVMAPGADDFFRRNGLLFRTPDELQSLLDAVSRSQAMMALASRELSLPNFMDTVQTFLERAEDFPDGQERLDAALGSMADVFSGAADGQQKYLSWQELMAGKRVQPGPMFVVASPVLDYSHLNPSKMALEAVRQAISDISQRIPGVRARLTGNVALRADDLKSVSTGIGEAFAVSFVLVGIALYIGLGSLAMVLASLGTLLVGLLATMAFAMAAIGSLNLISVAFIVLFVGLGIDYGIQYCLRFREFLAGNGQDARAALAATSRDIFPALAVCALTTAIGFFAFVPTEYVGASELGIISGSGMFILLVVSITLLPALLAVAHATRKPVRGLSLPLVATSFPAKRSGSVLAVSAALAVASLALLPRVGFDNNPLNLSNPDAESVRTAEELFETPSTAPWHANLLADSLQRAEAEADRLKQLDLVGKVVTVADFVPPDQDGKLWFIDDLALVLPPLPGSLEPQDKGMTAEAAALAEFRTKLQAYIVTSGSQTARELSSAVDQVLQAVVTDGRGAQVLDDLRRGLLLPLAEQVGSLHKLTTAQPFGLDDLPHAIRADYVSQGPEPKYRVQIFPAGDISTEPAMRAFNEQLGAAAPEASGPPFAIVGAGDVIFDAFTQAVLVALVLITVFLAVIFRDVAETVLTLAPLLLALAYSLGLSVAAGVPFNFANIIVIPLILGIGIDYAIHLMFRYRVESAGAETLLETGTARGVLFSALTTMLSFGSLCFSSHRGTASMGVLLTLAGTAVIVSTLFILPALLSRVGPRLFDGRRPDKPGPRS